MKKTVILALAACSLVPALLRGQSHADSLPQADYGSPVEYELGGVTVSGTRYLNEEVLVTLSGLVVGEKITVPGEKITKAVRNLWKQGLFSGVEVRAVRVTDGVVYLEIHLQERPRLSGFTISGTGKSDADDLKDKIGLIKGKPVTENLKVTIDNIITDYYVDKGFYNVKVRQEGKPDTAAANSEHLHIAVEKGYRVRVDEISFSGNEVFPGARLRRLMKETRVRTKLEPVSLRSMREYGVFDRPDPLYFLSTAWQYTRDHLHVRVFSSSKFIRDEFEEDKLKIIKHYNSKGYRDAGITGDTVRFLPDGYLHIALHVNEGKKYYFRNIAWNGNNKYTSARLSEVLGIKKGDLYNQTLLETQLYANPNGRDISSLYMDEGYLFFQVTPVEVAVDNDSIDLEIRVYEGPQATINRVTIVGNTKTNEHVIRRELRTLPGNKFSRSDIIRSQREIASLGFFNPENLDVRPTPHPEDGTVDIEYVVEEKPSDQLELSAGWGGRQLVGTIGVSFNNFSMRNIFNGSSWAPLPSGDGQRLSLRASSTGKYYQSVNASFTEPWLGGKRPNSLSVASYASLQSNGIDKEDTSRQSLFTTGGTLSYGIRMSVPDDYFSLHSAVEYQRFSLSRWFNFGFLFTDGVSHNLSFQETLSRNSTDQPLYPRTGSNLTLALKFTPPYSLFSGSAGDSAYWAGLAAVDKYKFLEYHKWKFDAEWYTPVRGNLVLKARASFGFLGYYNKWVGHSPFEQFEIGGDGISNFVLYGKEIIALRGYDPLDPNPAVSGVQTGTIFDKFSLELRYPLSLNPMSTIYALAFLDGGNSWLNFKQYDPFKIKRSAGLGVRIFLPMIGLIGVDYGIGFDKGLGRSDNLGDFLNDHQKFSIILGFEPY